MDDLKVRSSDAAPAFSQSSGRGAAQRLPRVLIVEDELLIRLYVADALRDYGFETLEAADAEHALRVVDEAAVDLVFTDITLPGAIDGFELARRVIASATNPPVILTSGRHNATVARQLCPTAPFLTKPYELSDLVGWIRKLLGIADERI